MTNTNNIPPWIKKARERNSRDKRKPNEFNYSSYKWTQTSIKYRTNNPECVECGKPYPTIKGLVLDHIIPIEQDGSIWNEANHQSMCAKPCHARKSQADKKGYKGNYKLLPNGKKIPV